MAIRINGNNFPTTNTLKVNSTNVTKVVCNGTTVWEKVALTLSGWGIVYQGQFPLNDDVDGDIYSENDFYYYDNVNARLNFTTLYSNISSASKIRITYIYYSEISNSESQEYTDEFTITDDKVDADLSQKFNVSSGVSLSNILYVGAHIKFNNQNNQNQYVDFTAVQEYLALWGGKHNFIGIKKVEVYV